MRGVSEQHQLPGVPPRNLVHVQQCPDLQSLKIDHLQQRCDRRLEIAVNAQENLLAHSAIPPWDKSACRRSSSGRGMHTLSLRGRQLAGMDANKVHHGIVVAGIHHQAAIVGDPHGHVSLPASNLCGGGVLADLRNGDHETEGALPGAKGSDLRASHNFAGDGLKPVSMYNHVFKGVEGQAHTLTPSAPNTRSPEKEAPSSKVTVAVSGSTDATTLEVLSTAGVPAPSGDIAWRLSSSWRATRWESTQG